MHYKQWIPITIRALRQSNNMRLKDLAEKSGLSVSYISDIEVGRTLPSLETLDNLLTCLGTTLTLGAAADYTPPGYVWVSRQALKELAEIVDDIAPKEDTQP